MSLHNAAKYLEAKGRDGDSMLVHMSPGEVKGLQALALAHGGSLSINPNTGLVEANFLKRILPMVAGAALSPFLTPMGAAAVVGGFEGIRTGDLGRGLMAGLGAYGGAGLTQGLSTAGAQTGAAGTTAAGTQATPVATENVGANMLKESAGLGGTTSVPTSNVAAETLRSTAPAPVTGANIRAGIGQLGSEAGRSAVYQALPSMTVPTTGMAIANATTPEYQQPGLPSEEDEGPYKLKRLSANFQGYTPAQPNPYYRPTGLGYAAGGDVMMAGGGSYSDEPLGDIETMASGGIASYSSQGQVRHLPRDPGVSPGIFRDTDPDTARKEALEAALILNRKAAGAAGLKTRGLPKTNVKGLGDISGMTKNTEELAIGGSIGGYSDGGRMLKGPGDGMSDSIPATIGKRQPARLADGEFVVPADVVSHLGNGSTDAGARKLYKMMDKVRMARTGKKKQAPAVKTDKYLPA